MSNKIVNDEFSNELNKDIICFKNRDKKSAILQKKVLNLSHLKTYTIDDKETLEIDDAISLEIRDGKYKLWIHIASPAANLEYNSPIDKSARKLISSLYLTTTNIYMLPKILIEDLYSLTTKEKRPSLSLGVVFNNDASIYSTEMVQSLIKPNYKLSYEEADELIDYAPKEEEDLSIISKILEKRKFWRKKRGATEILESQGKIVVNDNIPRIKIIDPTLSRQLISEAMILYGDVISNYTYYNNIPVPYRVQESKSILIDNNNSINNIIYTNFLLKQNMSKTYYSLSKLRHNSLGLNSYVHATSPIRRYCDLLVHYQLNRFINNKDLISKEDIEIHISEINNLSKQNIMKYREDQKIWKHRWFKNNQFLTYKVIFLKWINRYKNICIIYFIDFSFSYICHLTSKLDIRSGEEIIINNITNDYNDILYFKLNL